MVCLYGGWFASPSPVCFSGARFASAGGGLLGRRRFASAGPGLPARGGGCLYGGGLPVRGAVCLSGGRLASPEPFASREAFATTRGSCRRESMCRLPAPHGSQISLKLIQHEYKSGRKVFSVRTDEVLAAFCPTEQPRKAEKKLMKFAMEDGCVSLL